MARFGLMLITAVVLMVSIQEAFALKCYKCNSTSLEHCGDKFKKDKIPETLGVCQESRNSPAVCLKTKDKSGFISRSCGFKHYLDSKQCKSAMFCDVCYKDGCNGAAQYGPAAIIVTIPIAMMKIFSML